MFKSLIVLLGLLSTPAYANLPSDPAKCEHTVLDFEAGFIKHLDAAKTAYSIENPLVGETAVKAVVTISEAYGVSPPDVEMDRLEFISVPSMHKVLVIIGYKGCYVNRAIISTQVYEAVAGRSAAN